ncbi:hypothetical protein L1049_023473 [Liquidambar formosana]|uniref:AAA-type ATPase N-terminal domain-containing protein n=1 Tax=Liquidambar formosana TaxID=63359 RepID=A0AAP0WYU7_LIQFO
MYSLNDMPSPSSMFSAYASMAASIMLFRSMANDLVPKPIRAYLFSTLCYLFKRQSNELTLVIEEQNSIGRNQVYDASEIYLCTKISPDAERLKIVKSPKEKSLTIQFEKGEKIEDSYEGIDLKWRFICVESEKSGSTDHQRRQGDGTRKQPDVQSDSAKRDGSNQMCRLCPANLSLLSSLMPLIATELRRKALQYGPLLFSAKL